MKRKLISVMAAVMVFAFAASAFAAATAQSAQTLYEQVGAKITELKATTLTSSQTKSLTSIEKSYAKLAKTYSTTKSTATKPSTSAKPSANMPKQDTEREAKITAFKATLTEAQKTAYEALTLPARSEGAMPSGSPPPMPTGDMTGTPPTGAPSGERPQGGGQRMTDEERQAMETKRTAFIATLSESQKKAYDEIFPQGQGQAPQAGTQTAQTTQTTAAATIDFSALSSSKLTKLEKELNSLMTKLGKIK